MSARPKKILMVDDEPEACFVVSRALEEDGYATRSVFSGEEALEAIAHERPDLMLLDIRMPGLDGVEVLTRLREFDKELAVIIVSAFENVNMAVKCMRLGAFDYITKPINLHELKITVSNAFRTLSLQSEVERLRGEVEKGRGLSRFVGDSPAVRQVQSLIRRVAQHDITVLITGESGTGKEVVAESIHQLSPRSGRPMISLDCAALPEHLVESELFGYEKGAFTGAADRKPGRFELAQGGTLFLDEIGNLPLATQMKLLRVLQERQVQRLGGKAPHAIDVRVVAATNVDLQAAIRKGEFREDLYHRLNEFSVNLPPLRERDEDLWVLVAHFLHQFNTQFGKRVAGFSAEARAALARHPWPGNVRELQNAVKRAVVLAEGEIGLAELPPELSGRPKQAGAAKGVELSLPGLGHALDELSLKEATQQAVRQIELDMIKRALEATHWNKVKAAKLLKIDYKTLYNKLREHQIE